MQKFAILTLAVSGLWIAAFGLPDRTAIAWQQAQPAPPQTRAEPGETETTPSSADEFDPATLNPPIDPAVAAEARAMLQQARDQLYDTSVDAKLVQRASFGRRRFRAEGKYQTGIFPQLRLEYHIRVGESVGVVREICDGQILLTHKYIQAVGAAPDEIDPSQYQVSHKDIRRILQASGVAGTPPQAVLQAELGIGGLPALLASIERTMEFESLQQQQYAGRPYTVLQGRWRQEFLQSLDNVPDLARAAQQIAVFMPSRIRIYLNPDTLFPERILYLQHASLDPVTYHAIMSIEFEDVKLFEDVTQNEGVSPDTFRITPPPEGVQEIDETNLYIQMIEQYRDEQAGVSSGTSPATSESSAAPGTGSDN